MTVETEGQGVEVTCVRPLITSSCETITSLQPQHEVLNPAIFLRGAADFQAPPRVGWLVINQATVFQQ